MEVRQRVVGEVLLAGLEFEVAHLGLHDDWFIDFAVHCLLVDVSQDVDRARDAVLQLGECRLVVFESHVVHDAQPDRKEFDCVGAGLDLIW